MEDPPRLRKADERAVEAGRALQLQPVAGGKTQYVRLERGNRCIPSTAKRSPCSNDGDRWAASPNGLERSAPVLDAQE